MGNPERAWSIISEVWSEAWGMILLRSWTPSSSNGLSSSESTASKVDCFCNGWWPVYRSEFKLTFNSEMHSQRKYHRVFGVLDSDPSWLLNRITNHWKGFEPNNVRYSLPVSFTWNLTLNFEQSNQFNPKLKGLYPWCSLDPNGNCLLIECHS